MRRILWQRVGSSLLLPGSTTGPFYKFGLYPPSSYSGISIQARFATSTAFRDPSFVTLDAQRMKIEDILGYSFKDHDWIKAALFDGPFRFHDKETVDFRRQLAVIGDGLLTIVYFTHNLTRDSVVKFLKDDDLPVYMKKHGPFRSTIASNVGLTIIAKRHDLLRFGPQPSMNKHEQLAYDTANTPREKRLAMEHAFTRCYGTTIEAIFGAVFMDSNNNLAVTKAAIENLLARRDDDRFTGSVLDREALSRDPPLTAQELAMSKLMLDEKILVRRYKWSGSPGKDRPTMELDPRDLLIYRGARPKKPQPGSRTPFEIEVSDLEKLELEEESAEAIRRIYGDVAAGSRPAWGISAAQQNDIPEARPEARSEEKSKAEKEAAKVQKTGKKEAWLKDAGKKEARLKEDGKKGARLKEAGKKGAMSKEAEKEEAEVQKSGRQEPEELGDNLPLPSEAPEADNERLDQMNSAIQAYLQQLQPQLEAQVHSRFNEIFGDMLKRVPSGQGGPARTPNDTSSDVSGMNTPVSAAIEKKARRDSRHPKAVSQDPAAMGITEKLVRIDAAPKADPAQHIAGHPELQNKEGQQPGLEQRLTDLQNQTSLLEAKLAALASAASVTAASETTSESESGASAEKTGVKKALEHEDKEGTLAGEPSRSSLPNSGPYRDYISRWRENSTPMPTTEQQAPEVVTTVTPTIAAEEAAADAAEEAAADAAEEAAADAAEEAAERAATAEKATVAGKAVGAAKTAGEQKAAAAEKAATTYKVTAKKGAVVQGNAAAAGKAAGTTKTLTPKKRPRQRDAIRLRQELEAAQQPARQQEYQEAVAQQNELYALLQEERVRELIKEAVRQKVKRRQE